MVSPCSFSKKKPNYASEPKFAPNSDSFWVRRLFNVCACSQWGNFACLHIHTYIIGHYNPSVIIIDLVSHTTYVVWVNFLYISGGTYSLKLVPNDRFVEKLFMAIFIYSREFLPEICWDEIATEILLRILFRYLAWGSNSGFLPNKPTHYLLEHSDFKEYRSLSFISVSVFIFIALLHIHLLNLSSKAGGSSRA